MFAMESKQLKLVGFENYESWKINMEKILQHEDLYNAVMVDNEGKVVEKDSKKLLQAKSVINSMLSEDVRANIHSLTTARNVWLKLEVLYGKNGLSKRLKLLRKLFSLKLQEDYSGIPLAVSPEEYDIIVTGLNESGMKMTTEVVKSETVQFLDNSYLENELISSQGNDQGKTSDISSVSSINILNDDCLLNIFSYLSPIGRIKIERVCKRWKLISQESWRTVKKLHVRKHFSREEFTLNQLEEVLRRSGKFLTHLDLDHTNTRIINPYIPDFNENYHSLPALETTEIINKYCKTLHHLNVSMVWKEHNYFHLMGDHLVKNLKSLSVGYFDEWSDEHLPGVLKNALNLEYFSVVGYDFSKGNILLNLCDKVSALSVPCSTNLSNEMLKEVLEKHPKINFLEISVTKLTAKAFPASTEQFTTLKLFNMKNFFDDDEEIFNTLKFPNLKILDLGFNEFALTDEKLLKLVKNSPLIEELQLEVRGNFHDYYYDFSFLQNLKRLNRLNVTNTGIDETVLIELAGKSNQLKKLRCVGCKYVSESGVKRIKAASPDLIIEV